MKTGVETAATRPRIVVGRDQLHQGLADVDAEHGVAPSPRISARAVDREPQARSWETPKTHGGRARSTATPANMQSPPAPSESDRPPAQIGLRQRVRVAPDRRPRRMPAAAPTCRGRRGRRAGSSADGAAEHARRPGPGRWRQRRSAGVARHRPGPLPSAPAASRRAGVGWAFVRIAITASADELRQMAEAVVANGRGWCDLAAKLPAAGPPGR